MKQYKLNDMLGPQLTAVKVVDREVKGCKFDWYTVKAETMPEIILILDIIKYSETISYLQYFYNNKLEYRYMLGNFLVEKIDGECELKNEYQKKQMTDLKASLVHGFAIGSDPEMFVENKDGQIIPAFDFLGSKTEKKHLTMVEHRPVYWDGFQAEFETVASTCLSYHVDSVYFGLKTLINEAIKHNKDARISSKTTFDISPEALQTAKDEHVAFGCMPSLNAYGLKGLEMPGREAPFRSAGGHIHFGIGPTLEENAIPIVKALDAILGVACVSLFAKFDDPRRRKMYGLAGEYRLPKHGLEYRTLSNAWLAHPLIMHLVFDLSRKVVVFGRKGLMKFWECPEEITVETIMNCDVEKARNILDWNKELVLNIFTAAYKTKENAEKVFQIFRYGMETVILNPNDIGANWLLGQDAHWPTHSEAPGKSLAKALPIIDKKEKVG